MSGDIFSVVQCRRLDADAQVAKFSHRALLQLTDYYRALDEADQQVA